MQTYGVVLSCLTLLYICQPLFVQGMDPKKEDELVKPSSRHDSPNQRPKIHGSPLKKSTAAFNPTLDQINELSSKVNTHDQMLQVELHTLQAEKLAYDGLRALYDTAAQRITKLEQDINTMGPKINTLTDQYNTQQKENERTKRLENQVNLINNSYTTLIKDYSEVKKEVAECNKMSASTAQTQKATDVWCTRTNETVNTCVTQLAKLKEAVDALHNTNVALQAHTDALQEHVSKSHEKTAESINTLYDTVEQGLKKLNERYNGMNDTLSKEVAAHKEKEAQKKDGFNTVIDTLTRSAVLLYGTYRALPLLPVVVELGGQLYTQTMCGTLIRYAYVPAAALFMAGATRDVYTWSRSSETVAAYTTAWREYFTHKTWLRNRWATPTQPFLYTAAFFKACTQRLYRVGDSLLRTTLTAAAIDMLMLAAGAAAALTQQVTA